MLRVRRSWYSGQGVMRWQIIHPGGVAVRCRMCAAKGRKSPMLSIGVSDYSEMRGCPLLMSPMQIQDRSINMCTFPA